MRTRLPPGHRRPRRRRGRHSRKKTSSIRRCFFWRASPCRNGKPPHPLRAPRALRAARASSRASPREAAPGRPSCQLTRRRRPHRCAPPDRAQRPAARPGPLRSQPPPRRPARRSRVPLRLPPVSRHRDRHPVLHHRWSCRRPVQRRSHRLWLRHPRSQHPRSRHIRSQHLRSCRRQSSQRRSHQRRSYRRRPPQRRPPRRPPQHSRLPTARHHPRHGLRS